MTECDGYQKDENSIALEHTMRDSVGQRFLFQHRIESRSTRVSAEERSCLEGVYTVRMSEKQAGAESEKMF